jgi:hypothetical protein
MNKARLLINLICLATVLAIPITLYSYHLANNKDINLISSAPKPVEFKQSGVPVNLLVPEGWTQEVFGNKAVFTYARGTTFEIVLEPSRWSFDGAIKNIKNEARPILEKDRNGEFMGISDEKFLTTGGKGFCFLARHKAAWQWLYGPSKLTFRGFVEQNDQACYFYATFPEASLPFLEKFLNQSIKSITIEKAKK